MLAAEAQVTVDWVHGDAEDLPFADATFDVVTSSFGCMFAPRHRVVADELARVLRPGGRLVLTAWTPRRRDGRPVRDRRAAICHPRRRSPSRRSCGATRTTSPACSRTAACS